MSTPLTEVTKPVTPSSTLQLPYRPGPIGRLIAWIGHLPHGGWWLIAGLLVAQLAWSHAVLWASGRLDVGALDWTGSALAVYAPWGIAALAVGVRVANEALAAFWPATGWPDSARPEWAFRFSYAPARYEWPALMIGAASGVLALVASQDSVLGPPEGRVAVYLAYAPTFILGYSIAALAFVPTVHWLRLVAQIHREAVAIDPFDRIPIYAFSRLTVLVGLSYVLVTYYSFAVNGAFQAGNLPSLSFNGLSVATGVVAFLAPLWGIHGRLVRQKQQLALDVERRVTRLADELYARIDADDFAATPALDATFAVLTALRERVGHLPTWPWPPELLRGFVSALLLPIVVFIASRLVGTLLP